MFYGSKAKRLGLQDLGRVSEKVNRKYSIHQSCGTQFRRGRTEDNKIVYWCPKCNQVIRQKDGIPIENLRDNPNNPDEPARLIEYLVSGLVICAFIFIAAMMILLIVIKIVSEAKS